MIQFRGKVAIAGLVMLTLLIAVGHARGDQNYSDQVFFENSLSPENYFYSSGKVSAPSTLALVDGKLPVEREFHQRSKCSQTAVGVFGQWRLVGRGKAIRMA